MALTLGRKLGEKVYIVDEYGREIQLEVVKTEGDTKNTLKFRITAPPEFKIIREEIYSDNNS